MKRKMKRLLCFLLAAMMCAYMLPLNIFAWSYMTHVNSANLTMMEMLSFAENASGGRRTSPVVQIYAPYDDPENGTYTYSIPNEFYRAIKEYPEAFRAGSLGPDFYPDMVIGQTYIHPYDAEIKIGSGDWLRLLVESANRLPQYSEERLEAVSFILGFMLHYCGDMFGHDFVNTFSGGTFPTLTDVNITDTTTPELNNMMSHMSVESMIDDLMNEAFFGQNEDGIGLPIKAPTRFIADSLLLNGSMKAGAADIYYDFEQASDDGLLSGIPFYIDLIVDLREDVMEVADEYRPNTELFTMAISSYADQWAQDIDRALYALVDTFDMIAHRLVTGEENPKILEETLEDWLINGYPLKEMLKDKLEIDDAEGTVGIIMEELSLWLEDYGWKALGIPDIFIDGLPEEIDDVMKVFTFGIDFILARLKEVFSALFAEIIYAAARGEMLDAIGLASLLDDRLKDPRIQLDHADNPYKPSQNNFNDLVEYLRPYALEQQKLNNKDIRDTIANSDGKGTLAHVTDSEFASFYNTMAMFKMILMGPDNFNSFVKTVTGAAPASAYTKNVGALEATVVRLDVTTYDTEYAGTDDNVYAYVYRVNANGSRTLVGTKLLDNSLENNLEAGHTDSFYIELDEAVGVSQLEIQLGQKGTATANGG